ncbi:unnamed protein product [Linum tenue]|uniref:Uncharacterized protein n=1 Tax=Linum tenue TaxID=586396 RepID=A0AAV0QYW8_9ROSI|nr:unnamed protein product [Linum tenue]
MGGYGFAVVSPLMGAGNCSYTEMGIAKEGREGSKQRAQDPMHFHLWDSRQNQFYLSKIPQQNNFWIRTLFLNLRNPLRAKSR